MRKNFLSIVFALGIVAGVFTPAMAETKTVPPVGITQSTADGLYGSLAGEAAWGGTQDFSLATMLAKAFTADTHVATRIAGDGRWAQLAVANTFLGVNTFPAGTSTDPSIEIGESNTGLLLSKAGRIGLAIAGTGTVMTVDATGVVLDGNFTAGNENTDTATFRGDDVFFTTPNDVEFIFTSDFLATGASVMRWVTSFQIAGDLEIEGTDGVRISPGSDIDADIFSIAVAGGPKAFWDESDDEFESNKGWQMPALGAGATPGDSAIIDMTSTTQGLGLANMTTTQRDAITLPKTGLVIFDTTAGMSMENVGTPASPVWAGVGGGGPTIKSGAETSGSFSGNPLVATVTFGTAFSDANYSVSIVGIDERTWTVDSQAAGSFVINTNAAQSITANVSWTAIAHFDP